MAWRSRHLERSRSDSVSDRRCVERRPLFLASRALPDATSRLRARPALRRWYAAASAKRCSARCRTPKTLLVYPFRFELDVLFRFEGSALAIEASVRNTGTETMPASLGFHPAFRWPLPYGEAREAHCHRVRIRGRLARAAPGCERTAHATSVMSRRCRATACCCTMVSSRTTW